MQHLILLHGALGSKELYLPLLHVLENDFQCHTFNFSGHGEAPFESAFSIAQFAEELNDYMEKNNLHEALVFGHSMGGYAALYASAKGNKRIQKVITLGTKFQWTPEVAAKEAGLFEIEILKEKLPAFVSQLKLQHGTQWEDLVVKVKQLLLDLGNTPALTNEVLQSITIPVTLCLGEKDRMVTEEETRTTATKIINSKFIALPSQPHALDRVDTNLLRNLLMNQR